MGSRSLAAAAVRRTRPASLPASGPGTGSRAAAARGSLSGEGPEDARRCSCSQA